jgi:hypothetical protein
MLTPDTLLFRIDSAEKYLRIIDEPLPGYWSDLFQEAFIRRDLQLALALIHPRHWEDISQRRVVLGERAFNTPTLRGTQYCCAEDYWGVPCATRTDRNAVIVADHAWPYSLGGPTNVANIRWLCGRHNAAKSSDVHLYPWEFPMPDWLPSQLQRVKKLRELHGLTR